MEYFVLFFKHAIQLDYESSQLGHNLSLTEWTIEYGSIVST